MLGRSDRPIDGAMKFLARFGIEAGYIVPTETGLNKSILDAHRSLRDYLRQNSVHDFDAQRKGGNSKVVLRGRFIGVDGSKETTASLYRPETKQGDPRIWFSGLARYATAFNLLAILALDGELNVVNMSSEALLASAATQGSPLRRLLDKIATRQGAKSQELLGKLRDIASRGFVPSLRGGPTGVGMTLETMLGISANSSRAPDFHGIEVKAGRVRAGQAHGSRTTLFSRVPDWKNSRITTALSLLEQHGYDVDGRRQLYCSLNNQPNSLGLFLEVEEDQDTLHSRHGTRLASAKVVQWPMSGLQKSLRDKHNETFWVKAKVRRLPSGVEEFHYMSVTHTKAALTANLAPLLDGGFIELDFVMHLVAKEDGKPRARDHGYLFKIHPKNLGMLFPPPVTYTLI